MKKICIALILLSIVCWVYAAFDTKKLDKKLDIVQEKILNWPYSDSRKIRIFQGLILKLEKYKTSKNIEIISYIQEDFQESLDDFKRENNYINTLVLASENGWISDYKILNYEFSIWKKQYLVLREFVQNNTRKYLILDISSYETQVIESDMIREFDIYGEIYNTSDYKEIQDTLYSRWVNTASPLQNNWLHSALHSHDDEVYITADFCPSGKHWFEKEIIEDFMRAWHKEIAIAITSAWINGHPQDYQELLDWNNSGQLNITWMNHTKSHLYTPGHDFSRNFILTPGLILDDEIVDVEKKLLEKAQIPSLFMRFPGLVSDDETRKKVIYHYGLIPLGSDAWLAKWEHPQEGSIILIHGNKNEPAGIPIMRSLLKNQNFEYGALENVLK